MDAWADLEMDRLLHLYRAAAQPDATLRNIYRKKGTPRTTPEKLVRDPRKKPPALTAGAVRAWASAHNQRMQ